MVLWYCVIYYRGFTWLRYCNTSLTLLINFTKQSLLTFDRFNCLEFWYMHAVLKMDLSTVVRPFSWEFDGIQLTHTVSVPIAVYYIKALFIYNNVFFHGEIIKTSTFGLYEMYICLLFIFIKSCDISHRVTFRANFYCLVHSNQWRIIYSLFSFFISSR